MTLERAAELVALIRLQDGEAAIDLFSHFVDYFDLKDEEPIKSFAILCGYAIAIGIKTI